MSDSSFYSNTGTTSASISSITTLNAAATASKNAAAVSATASAASATGSAASATASQVSNAAALVSKNSAATSASTATTKADLATSNGATQVALATTQANLATSNGAAKVTLATAQVALATTQANLATSNGAAKVTLATAQVALATTQAGLATSNGAAKVALATAQVVLATAQTTAATAQKVLATEQKTLSIAQVALATTKANNAATSATASAASAAAALVSKNAAAASAAAALVSKNAAAASASTASTQASNASTSAAAALSNKNLAVAAKAAAETAETNSESARDLSIASKNTSTTQASASGTSAAAALVSKNAAAASASAAATSLTSFTDVYKGSASSAPSGSTGDLYYDTNSNSLKVYNGSAWVAAYISAAGYANLSGSTFSGSGADLFDIPRSTFDGRDVSVDGTKLDTVAASSNNYTHPNHSGVVTSTADGATAMSSNVALPGSPTTTTQSATDNSTKIATTAYADAAVAALADSAPSTLNTLNEIAAALGDDANYAASTTTAIGLRMLKSGGAFTGALTTNSTFDGRDVATDGTKLDTIASSANNYSHPTGAGNNHVPTGGSSGQFLKYSASGVAVWAADNNTTYSVGDGGLSQINFTSADHSKLNGIAASSNAYVHPNHSGDVVSSADGATTIQVDAVDIAMLSATGTASSTTFLRGDNAWVTPTDTNTTYSVGDGGLSQINFTSADHTKLNAIEASADVTDATNVGAAGALMKSDGTMTGNLTRGGSVYKDGSITDTGDFTLDVAGDIHLDADGADIVFKDAGTAFGKVSKSSNDFRLKSEISDGDFVVQGNDGGSAITCPDTRYVCGRCGNI